jgi:hypothetical protein
MMKGRGRSVGGGGGAGGRRDKRERERSGRPCCRAARIKRHEEKGCVGGCAPSCGRQQKRGGGGGVRVQRVSSVGVGGLRRRVGTGRGVGSKRLAGFFFFSGWVWPGRRRRRRRRRAVLRLFAAPPSTLPPPACSARGRVLRARAGERDIAEARGEKAGARRCGTIGPSGRGGAAGRGGGTGGGAGPGDGQKEKRDRRARARAQEGGWVFSFRTRAQKKEWGARPITHRSTTKPMPAVGSSSWSSP